MRLHSSVSPALKSVASVSRIPAVLLALSVLSFDPTRGAGDEADQMRPAVEELIRAVADLAKRDAPAENRAQAAEKIGRLGSRIQGNGPNILVPALQDRREAVRLKAARTLHEAGPTVAYAAVRYHWLIREYKPHQDASPAVRREMISVMVLVGRIAPELVVPALWQMVCEDKRLDLRLRAAAGLMRIFLGLGPTPDDPVEDLIPQHTVQKYAAFLPVVDETTKALAIALKDPDEQVRAQVVKAILELGPNAVLAAIPQLLEALQEKRPALRADVVSALGHAGRQGRGRIGLALVRAVKDSNKEVRIRAVGAVQRVRPPNAVSVLIEALKENDAQDIAGLSVCRSAAWALATMGSAAKDALPAVVEQLESKDPRLQFDALLILQAVGSGEERVAPALRKVMRHKEKGFRVLAAAYLSKLGPGYHKETLPVLLEGLDVRNIDDQSLGGSADARLTLVANALGEMGPYADEAVPKLRTILSDAKRQVVHGPVKEALQKIRP